MLDLSRNRRLGTEILSISVLILTKNEQADLPGCLDAVSWSDDIHVFDSFSTDKTVEIAQAKGAHITQREFDNWAAHQNWGLTNIKFKYPWVLYVDADERVTEELRESLLSAVAHSEDFVAFEVQRRDFFMNRWLKHVQASPFYLRLFRPEKMRYERLVNPVSIPDGPTKRISGYLDHYPFSKGIGHWINRHNSYSELEARQIVSNRENNSNFSIIKTIKAETFHERRFHQKELFYRLPARPLVKFLLLYFGKRGVLDGAPGLTYSLLQSIYEYFIVLKTNEFTARRQSDQS